MTLYPTSSSNHGNSASSGVVNINDVGKLSAELHVPHLADHDAISARATVSVGISLEAWFITPCIGVGGV